MKRIEVQTAEFEGQNALYLLGEDADGSLALVDTGIDDREVREQIERAVEEVGRKLSEVDDVFLTHYHNDHVGLAAVFQSRSDATVHAPAADAALIAGRERAWKELRATLEARFDQWGMPSAKRQALLDATDGFRPDRTRHPTVEPFEAGDRFRFDWGTLEAIDLPGHTDGHAGFVRRRDDRREVFCGDALLPEYTPNVGGADVRVDDALATYVRTLDSIAAGEYARAYPGHRRPIANPSARATEIRAHHLDRTRRVLDVLDDGGPMTAWEVSRDLFGALSGIHVLHGPGEAGAHLEHLRRQGVVSAIDGRYRRVDREVAVETLFG